MPQVMVRVLSINQDFCPGIADFELTDAFGKTHSFAEKLPVIGIDVEESPYTAWIDCVVVQEKDDSILISTWRPHRVESATGKNEFEVPRTIFRTS